MSFRQAIVLGAGLGTRLRPLTHHRPKPGVPLFHLPMAVHAMRHLAASGVRRIAVNTHYLADTLEPLLRDAAPEGVELHLVREEELRGTGGGVKGAWGALDPGEPVVIMNGDIDFRPDLATLAARHVETQAIATMVTRPHPEASRLGAIDADRGGRVQRLLGTPAPRAFESTFMFTGVHALAPRAYDALPAEGCIIRRAYRGWVDEDPSEVFALPSDAPFLDLGTLPDYLEAHLRAHDTRAVHATADVSAEASIVRTWVGPRSSVAAGAVLEDCVVWPDTAVPAGARHTRTILGPFGVVEVAIDGDG